MDPRSFDRLARGLAHGITTRRGLFAALSTLAVGGQGTDAAPSAAGCGKAKQRCRRDKDCCAEFSCFAGKCACSQIGHNPCGKRCFDFKTNNNNCGRCKRKCKGDLRCGNGVCKCPNNRHAQCGTTCADLKTDKKHCGACGTACPGEHTCNAGVCRCADGLETCPDNICADVQNDPDNCGGCGTECEGDLACLRGECGCASGLCYLRSWTGNAGSGEPLQTPWGVAALADRTLLVADRQGNEIRHFSPTGANEDAWNAVGVAWVATDAGDGAYATFPSANRVTRYAGLPGGTPAWSVTTVPGAQGVAAYLDSAVYVAAGGSNQLFRLDPADGTIVWGTDGGAEQGQKLSNPVGVATDLDGNVYVADAGNGRIIAFRPNGTFWRALSANLRNPHGLAVDGGLLYVADRGNKRVAVLDLDGALLTSVETAGPLGALRDPVGVAVDRDGRLLVTDATLRRVIVYQPGENAAGLSAAAKGAKETKRGR